MTMIRPFTLLLLVLLTSSPALAQRSRPPAPAAADPARARDDEARLLFDAGQLAMEQGRYADALDYFERAYALSGRANMLFNIGTVAERLRRDERALEAYDAFVAAVPDSPMRVQAEARASILRTTLASRAAEPAPSDASPAASDANAAPAGAAPVAHEADLGVESNGARRSLFIASGGTALAAIATGAWWFERGDAFGECVDGTDAETVCTNRDAIRRQRAGSIVATGALGAGAITLLVLALTRHGSDPEAEVASCVPERIGLSCQLRF